MEEAEGYPDLGGLLEEQDEDGGTELGRAETGRGDELTNRVASLPWWLVLQGVCGGGGVLLSVPR